MNSYLNTNFTSPSFSLKHSRKQNLVFRSVEYFIAPRKPWLFLARRMFPFSFDPLAKWRKGRIHHFAFLAYFRSHVCPCIGLSFFPLCMCMFGVRSPTLCRLLVYTKSYVRPSDGILRYDV